VARLATQMPGRVPDLGPLTEGPGPTSSPGSLLASRVACCCSPVGFDRQHILTTHSDKQAWLAAYATGPSHDSAHSAPGVQTVDQISAILRDQFGIIPKRRAIGYTKPYPSDYDLIPLPPKYRLPEFTKFSGAEGSISIEHVSRYLAQLGMISVSDPLRVRFFSLSLTGPAFGWYTSLGPDSIRTWKQLEEQFHIQYHSEAAEAGIADLAQVRQKRGETVTECIQRFREVKN
jgi:hypothetical protein